MQLVSDMKNYWLDFKEHQWLFGKKCLFYIYVIFFSQVKSTRWLTLLELSFLNYIMKNLVFYVNLTQNLYSFYCYKFLKHANFLLNKKFKQVFIYKIVYRIIFIWCLTNKTSFYFMLIILLNKKKVIILMEIFNYINTLEV